MSKPALSKVGLDRMHEVMAGHVEHGGVPGIVTLVSRRGEVHVDAHGTMAMGGEGGAVRRDSIFRIASMTKPVAAVAAMILVEECTLRLDEPVDRWLPELADREVLRSLDGEVDDTVPAVRPITVRDVLTFRMGAGLIMAAPDTYPIQTALGARDSETGHRSRRRRPPRTSGSAGSARCRSCTSPASSGCTTRARMCSACSSRARPDKASRRFFASASSSRSGCATPGSACRRTRSTGW